MKRFLTLSVITLTLLFVAAPFTHAQTEGSICDYTDAGTQDGTIKSGKCVSNGTYGFNNVNGTYKQNVLANQSGTTTDRAAEKSPTTMGPTVDDTLSKVLSWIMSLFAWLLGVAAIVLDNAVYYTVVTMGEYISHLSAVGATWKILRDIGNIALIFGFLAVGISVILDSEWYGGKTKMLPMLIVGAVFLNFSLFFTEAIIDTSNLFATQFYMQINGGNAAGAKNFDLKSVSEEGISNKIMDQLGLAVIYANARTNTNVLPAGTSIFIAFMSIFLFIVAAFVMFSLAFVLIARFIYLIYLIILAPIGFVGMAIPRLNSIAKKWWGDLFEQTITAPVLLLLLYVALAIITDANFLGFGPKGNWTGFVPNSTGDTNFVGFASIFLSFLVAMGLLIFVVMASKKLSAFGADWASKTAGKLTFGATAWAGRSTVGWGSQRFSEKLRKTRLANVPILGRAVIGSLDRGAKASFDVRAVKKFGGLKELGINAGDAQKGGYRDWEKKKIKEREDYAKTLPGREQTKEEKAALDQLETEKRELKRAKNLATAEKNQATRNKKTAEDELARIKTEKDQDQYWATIPANQAREQVANTNLASATQNLEAAAKKLEQATNDLKIKEEEHTVKKDEVDEAMEERGGSQERYAKALTWGLGGWFNRNVKAAESIKKNAKKSKSERDVDTLKEILEKGSKSEDKSEDKDKSK